MTRELPTFCVSGKFWHLPLSGLSQLGSPNLKKAIAVIKKYSKVKIAIGPLFNAAKKLVSAPIQLAEILSEQYSSVFSTPLPAADISSNVLPENTLTDIIFTEEDLETAMVLAIPASAGHTARRRTERPECCAGGYCVTACSFYKLQQV